MDLSANYFFKRWLEGADPDKYGVPLRSDIPHVLLETLGHMEARGFPLLLEDLRYQRYGEVSARNDEHQLVQRGCDGELTLKWNRAAGYHDRDYRGYGAKAQPAPRFIITATLNPASIRLEAAGYPGTVSIKRGCRTKMHLACSGNVHHCERNDWWQLESNCANLRDFALSRRAESFIFEPSAIHESQFGHAVGLLVETYFGTAISPTERQSVAKRKREPATYRE